MPAPIDPLNSPDPLKGGSQSGGSRKQQYTSPGGSVAFVDNLVDVGTSSSSSALPSSGSGLIGDSSQSGSVPADDTDELDEMNYGTIFPHDTRSGAANAGGRTPAGASTPTKPGRHAATVSGPILVTPAEGAGSPRALGKIRLPPSFGRRPRASSAARVAEQGDDQDDADGDETASTSFDAGNDDSQIGGRSGAQRISNNARRGSISGANVSNLSFKRRAARSGAYRGANQRASVAVTDRSAGGAANRTSIFSNLRIPFRRVKTTSIHQGGGDESRFDEDLLNELRGVGDGEFGESDGKPYVPPMIPPMKVDPYTTPIPTLPFVVLCITIFSEFCSAGVAGPFLFFMIDDFNVGGEAEVGFWAGIVASAFFFAQFLTSMLWASVADKHGRRSVLLASLVGNTASMFLFGMATNLPTAMSIRLAQGLFNGAVGVAKGAVRDLTDETNEGRAYAIMGFCWGMGGIVGPILGGLLEHPVQKYPFLFGENEYFKTYPYLLPCIVASSFTLLGAFLSLFIGPDGGPREGAIALPEKADLERASQTIASNVESFGRSAGKRISGYFSKQDADAAEAELNLSHTRAGTSGTRRSSTAALGAQSPLPRTFTQQVDYETGGPPSPVESDYTIGTNNDGNSRRPRGLSSVSYASRPFSRTEFRRQGILSAGSAYGYDQRRPSRTSFATDRPRSQFAGSQSGLTATQYAPDFEDLDQPKPELNFAQRFLLANDDAVLSITDLWVAAAINGEDAYSTLDEDVFYEDEEEPSELLEDDVDDSTSGARTQFGEGASDVDESSSLLQPRHLPPLHFAQRKLSRGARSDAAGSYTSRPRGARRSSSGTRVPSLYSNTGLERPGSPLALLSPTGQNPPNLRIESRTPAFDPSLAGIPESRRASLHAPSAATTARKSTATQEKPPSLWSLLPLVLIAHYGVMSWHSSTFDQVFMAFLVTPYTSGGLGLTAAHFAELIAAMAFCQMYFQFVFYPKLSANFSHLSMLRIGLAIYLPCYTLFPLLRNFLHPSTDLTVMSGMILFASLRWLANVTAFTAVTILMNASTPPNLIPLANGLAQTTSSAARFIGPICGGLVWARSIEGGPEAHSWPFNYHLGFWMVGTVAFTGFLLSWKIR